MKELLNNLKTKMKIENFKTKYGVTIIENGRSTMVHKEAFTSMGAVRLVKAEREESLIVRVELAN